MTPDQHSSKSLATTHVSGTSLTSPAKVQFQLFLRRTISGSNTTSTNRKIDNHSWNAIVRTCDQGEKNKRQITTMSTARIPGSTLSLLWRHSRLRQPHKKRPFAQLEISNNPLVDKTLDALSPPSNQ